MPSPLKSKIELPVAADEQSVVCAVQRTVDWLATVESITFLPSSTQYPMPPASATSGVPSPLKSATVGGPPPLVYPALPAGQCCGSVPLMSTPCRTQENLLGCFLS